MRQNIDRTTDHTCEGLERDQAYFTANGRAMYVCVNCEAPIYVHYVQFAHLCYDCRRECTQDSDTAPQTCVYCNASI